MTLLEEEPRRLLVTNNESKLLTILEAFHKSTACPSRGALRIAGGWVRDKLMGTTSNDLDVALEDCTGKTYADAFQRWLNEEGLIRELNCKIIPANPDKSKHLETAMLTLMEFKTSLDFVNLRSETYSADSRIPSMEFGTPLQDAERRDFTINALFYNVLAHEVEDFTGRGLADLKAKILRTPLNATKTFLDDPLRLVRAIRFLAKLPDFIPDEEIAEAALDANVLSALKTKVSVDRVRAEIAKMMEYGERAARGFKFMYDWKLLPVMLDDAKSLAAADEAIKKRKKTYVLPRIREDDQEQPYTFGYQFLSLIVEIMIKIRKENRTDILSADSTTVFWDTKKFYNIDNIGAVLFTCLLITKFGGECQDPDKKGIITIAEYILVQLRSRGVASIATVLYGCFEALYQMLEQGPNIPRKDAAVILRTKGLPRWMEIALVMAASYKALIDRHQTRNEKLNINLSEVELSELIKVSLNTVIQARHHLREELALDNIWNLKPLLSGKAMPEVLPLLKSGPSFREVMDFQNEWIQERWHNGIDEGLGEDLRVALQAKFPQYV